MTTDYGDFVGRLHRTLDASPPYALPTVVSAVLAEAVGAKDVGLLLADYGEVTLERVSTDPAAGDGGSIPLDGTAAGRAFLRQETVDEPDDSGLRLYVPVTVRAERIGVLDVLRCNAELPAARLDEVAPLAPAASTLLEYKLRAGTLSGRGLHRVRRVARTLADLAGDGLVVGEEHVCLALGLRGEVGTEEAVA